MLGVAEPEFGTILIRLFGSGPLSGKTLLVGIIMESNKIDAYFRAV